MLNPSIPEWYAFYIRARHEKKVSAQIQRAGIESFLPLEKKLKKWQDRKKWVETPLFPSYVFTKIAYKSRYDILEVPSVVGIVGFHNEPCPVRQNEIDAIKLLLAHDSSYDVVPGLVQGSCVRICSGPLEGLEAQIAQVRGKERIVISIPALAKSIIMNTTGTMLKMIESRTL
ncbi:UpxY family transcription antiterminator [candidate division KSB1 bacterium]|nr:UpxY family transcription antiterminator [candidate division KSB1 bacterium]RQW01169.1 MAG: UpxY family transcription antiterminator [candidate division KSB1 bacterium]